MLIVSKFHDYYDSGMRNGVDKSLVYRRETAEVDAVQLPKRRSYEINQQVHDYMQPELRFDYRRHTIVFCGKPYIFWRARVERKLGLYWEETKIFYNASKSELLKEIREFYGLREPKKERSYAWRYNNHKRKSDKITFEEAVRSVDWEAIHVKAKSPVLILQGPSSELEKSLPKLDIWSDNSWHAVVKDPVLKDYGFERYVDPFTAWQEIGMYLGGVIGQPDRPMVEISDVNLRDKHGFDKWSFKTRPAA